MTTTTDCGYLPINNDGVRRRLVAVTTALLITAAAGRKIKLKGYQLVTIFENVSLNI